MFGVSGVGKSWMISNVAKNQDDFAQISASKLIKEAANDPLMKSEALRTVGAVGIDKNQNLLVLSFNKYLSTTEKSKILFDGHSVIDTDTGFFEIDVTVIQSIAPSTIIFVWDDPNKILIRRTRDSSRVRPVRTVEEIENYQSIALNVCKKYSTKLNIPLIKIRSGDLVSLEEVII